MQPFPKLILVLVLAHLLGDLPLPSARMRGQTRSVYRDCLRGGVHLVLLVGCTALFAGLGWLGSVGFWMIAVLYTVVHLAIDRMKPRRLARPGETGSTAVWVRDQLLHIATIVVTAWLLTRPTWSSLRSEFHWSPATGEKVLEGGIVYLLVMFAGGYLIGSLTRDLGTGMETTGGTAEQVKHAGMYIGWLERFLVVTAIVVQSPSLVGLILTGKSIARFPELKDDRFAEYFLIGTLLSIGLAVVGGLVLAKLWYGTISLK
jgi:Protein of unknown function (DUF3307)